MKVGSRACGRKFHLRVSFKPGGMFARAVSAPRLILAALAALTLLVAGCGGQRQDADEPSGTFKVDIAKASFPPKQHIAEQSTMRIQVHNPDSQTVPNVAVTVETKGANSADGVTAFGQKSDDSRLADANRGIWVLDDGPKGGTSAYANTWSLGPVRPGETKTFEWKLTPVEPGVYSIDYRVAPGLDGKARLAAGSKARGTFAVRIADEPVPARVNADGEVVRGEEAGAGKN
jgi:hypothetical protein